MEGHLHILVPVHLEDVPSLFVDDQTSHHVFVVKLKIQEILQVQQTLRENPLLQSIHLRGSKPDMILAET